MNKFQLLARNRFAVAEFMVSKIVVCKAIATCVGSSLNLTQLNYGLTLYEK